MAKNEIRVNGIMMFPKLKEPDPESNRYSVCILMEKEEAAKIAKEVKNIQDENPTKTLESPLRNGNDKEYEHFKNKYYVNAKTKFPIKIVNRAAKEIDKLDFDRYVYAGQEATFCINCYKYHKPKHGIAMGITGIHILETGDKIFTGPEFQPLDPITEAGEANDSDVDLSEFF